MKIDLQNLSLNSVLIFGAVIGGAFLYWKAKNTLSNVVDVAGDLVTVPKPTAANPQIAGYDKSHDAAMAKIGLDIKKFHVWYPNPLTPLQAYPAGSIKVKWGANKEFYTIYVPNTGGANFQIFTL